MFQCDGYLLVGTCLHMSEVQACGVHTIHKSLLTYVTCERFEYAKTAALLPTRNALPNHEFLVV